MNRIHRGARKGRRTFFGRSRNKTDSKEVLVKDSNDKVDKNTSESMDAKKEISVDKISVDNISAEKVFDYFREIAAIPHGSGNTGAIAAYLVKFAEAHRYMCRRDESDNVVIFVPASEGYEEKEPVILQGHLDMVCEKNSDVKIDMETEAITVLEDGDWIHADGTTLGADNGIAVAMMLALMDDPSVMHPALECVITADEEIGMLGAQALDVSDLKSKKMLNMDSEEDGVFTAGCAGGTEVIITLPISRKEKSGRIVTISVSGLLGGHSGDAIGKGRANADILLGRLLYELRRERDLLVISVNGGGKDNAIPRDAKAQILIEDDKKGAFDKRIEKLSNQLKEEYRVSDPNIKFTWSYGEKGTGAYVFTKKSTAKLLKFLMAAPNGVIEYSPDFESLPQTSLNLGILRTMADGVQATFLVRSSINSQKEMLKEKLACLASLLDADIEMHGEYPAWEYRAESPLRDEVMGAYEKVFGQKARIEVTHGGLECGLLAAKIPGLECVSFGPLMQDIHTPKERLSISSTVRTYQFLVMLLKNMKN